MDCRQAQDLITRAVSGNASRADQGVLEAHLASCAECDELHTRLTRVWGLMGRLHPVELPEHQTRAVTEQVRRIAFLRRLGKLGAAAAATVLLGVVAFVLFRGTPGQRPVVQTESKPEPAEAPPNEEAVRAAAVLVSIEEEKRTPEPPPPAPVVEPKPAPVEPPIPAPAPRPADPVAPPPQPPTPPAEKPVIATPVAPKPAPRETAAEIATLERLQGEAFVLGEEGRVAAKAGGKILVGQGLETPGTGSQAVVEFADGTRLVLGAETTITHFSLRPAAAKSPGGKHVVLARGVLAAHVSKQPSGEQMAFATPQAEARVLGTRLTLSVSSLSTLLEVTEGKVRLTRKEDGAAVDVTAGHYAVAGAKGTPLSAKTSAPRRVALSETFERSKWGQAWSQQAESGSAPRFAIHNGTLSLRFPRQGPSEVTPGGIGPSDAGKGASELGQKAIDSVMQGSAIGSKSEWPRTTWLETRQSFPLHAESPLRIQVRLWQSHADADRTTWVTLNRKPAAQALALERRGDVLQLWAGGASPIWKAEFSCREEIESLELWLTPDQIVVRRNDTTLHAGANPHRTLKMVQLSLGGGAKAHLAQDEEIRFDDVEVAWMTLADLAKILK